MFNLLLKISLKFGPSDRCRGFPLRKLRPESPPAAPPPQAKRDEKFPQERGRGGEEENKRHRHRHKFIQSVKGGS